MKWGLMPKTFDEATTHHRGGTGCECKECFLQHHGFPTFDPRTHKLVALTPEERAAIKVDFDFAFPVPFP